MDVRRATIDTIQLDATERFQFSNPNAGRIMRALGSITVHEVSVFPDCFTMQGRARFAGFLELSYRGFIAEDVPGMPPEVAAAVHDSMLEFWRAEIERATE